MEAEEMIAPKTFKKESKIIVSVQAQKILAHTKFTSKDLVDWRLSKGIGLGGNDVAFFLEEMEAKE